MSGKRPVIQCLPVTPVPITRVLYSRASRTRFGNLRRRTVSWCRSTRTSASNAARDRNSLIKAHQINLQRSLIKGTIDRLAGDASSAQFGAIVCSIPRELVFAHACKMGLEGIVSKRKDSTYRSGRSPDWLKMKNPEASAVKREAEEDWGR
jgi:hypothetical protein